MLALLAPILLLLMSGQAGAQSTDAFRKFLEALWPEVQAMGVSRPTFDAALRGVEPDLALPDHTGASFALRSRVGRGSLVLFFYLLNGTPT